MGNQRNAMARCGQARGKQKRERNEKQQHAGQMRNA